MRRLAVLAAIIACGVAAADAGATLAPPSSLICKPFRNTAKVVAFARKTLVYNGFHPNIRFECRKTSLFLVGVGDGVEYTGAVQKTGPHQIVISIVEHQRAYTGHPAYTDFAAYKVPFDV